MSACFCTDVLISDICLFSTTPEKLNRGAEEARGQYLVLLNNDTQVLDGWLDALLDTFDQFPDTGMAGARLVFPDGRLQEAGGIIFNDGSGWNYGKFDKADKPEYQFTREVDYCSGACIALPAPLFRELGGFDTRYSPAYYEDNYDHLMDELRKLDI